MRYRSPQLTRRTVLRGSAGFGVAALAGGCSSSTAPPPEPTTPSEDPTTDDSPTSADPRPGRTLLVYFSRPGENYYRGGRRNLEVGNTEVLARVIAGLVDCDVYRIEAADPYSADYDPTVARNVREQEGDLRPSIAEPLTSIDAYENVLLGSPIWNVRPPMIMATFAESFDFTGRTVHPFVTYAVSGLGRAERDYTAWCRGARLAPGLAIQGEEAGEHSGEVETWLRDADLLA